MSVAFACPCPCCATSLPLPRSLPSSPGAALRTKKTSFDTQGLRAPEGSCEVKPSRIGLAEKIRNIDEGNGCEIPNAWRVQSLGSVSFSQRRHDELRHGRSAEDLARETRCSPPPSGASGRASSASMWRPPMPAARATTARRQDERARLRQCHRHRGLHAGKRPQGDACWRAGAAAGTSAASCAACMSAACGEFRTVLGPDSDRHHRDHLHLDLQNRRNGSSYCR